LKKIIRKQKANLKKQTTENRGSVIVEAAFVFPIMFLVIFFLIYLGNAYYQKSRIDNYAALAALKGASYCADPFMKEFAPGSVPDRNDEIYPYRYYLQGVIRGIESDIKSELEQNISGTGFFVGMEPGSVVASADFSNHILYHTFIADASYTIKLPIKMLGSKDIYLLRLSSRAEVPVNDVSEFIRNTDMAIDYLESSEAVQNALKKVKEAFDKVKSFIGGTE